MIGEITGLALDVAHLLRDAGALDDALLDFRIQGVDARPRLAQAILRHHAAGSMRTESTPLMARSSSATDSGMSESTSTIV